MAQLKEDEWPRDGEPTTSEQEGGRVKDEGEYPEPPEKEDIREEEDTGPTPT